MEENSGNPNYHKLQFEKEKIKLVGRIIIPIIFLIAGLVILGFHLPGWSLIIGLPVTLFGVVFLIYAYDEVVAKKVAENSSEIWPCSICHRMTIVSEGDDLDDFICDNCKKNISKGIEKTK